MSVLNGERFFFNPHTLVEISLGAVFGSGCKESIAYLIQIPQKDAINAAIIVNRKIAPQYHTQYECNFESNCGIVSCVDYDEFFCSNYESFNGCNLLKFREVILFRKKVDKLINEFNDIFLKDFPFLKNIPFSKKDDCIYSAHPIYQVVHTEKTEDVMSAYRAKKDQISMLPMLPQFVDTESSLQEDILYYRDPLYFLHLSSNPRYENFIYTLLDRAYSFIGSIVSSITSLEEYLSIEGMLYYLPKALLLQIKHYNGTLINLITIRKSVDINCPTVCPKQLAVISISIIVCLRNYIRFVFSLKEIVMLFLDYSNFVSLEDIMVAFEQLVSNPRLEEKYRLIYKTEIVNISSFLRENYSDLVIKKRMKIDYFIGKLNVSNEEMESFLTTTKDDLDKNDLISFFAKSIIKSVKDLMCEIEKIESSLENLPKVDLSQRLSRIKIISSVISSMFKTK